MKKLPTFLKFFLINVAAALVLMVGISIYVLYWLDDYTEHGTFIVVPDLHHFTPDEAQALAAHAHLQTQVIDSLYDTTQVSMSIYQPRRENVSTWTISVDELNAWAENILKPKAELAHKGEGDYLPGPWCQFCKAAVKCRARAEEKLQLAQFEFAPPPLLSDEEVEEILGKLDDLTKWASEIQAYAQDAAVNHGKVWQGFKLVATRTNRRYTDEEAVVKAANEAGYHDIFKKSLIPITEMEKLMGKKNFKNQK